MLADVSAHLHSTATVFRTSCTCSAAGETDIILACCRWTTHILFRKDCIEALPKSLRMLVPVLHQSPRLSRLNANCLRGWS